MANLENKFSVSPTSLQKFLKCPREHYLARYVAWGGWDRNASRTSRMAYRLKMLSSPQMLSGDLVHKAIQADMEAIKAGGPYRNTNETAKELREKLSQAYAQSEDCEVLTAKKPKEVVTFAGDFYPSMRRWKKDFEDTCRDMLKCYERYCDSSILSALCNGTELVDSVEALEMMDFRGACVYVKMDLLTFDGLVYTVHDWKTGKRKEEDYAQICLYAYYLNKARGYRLQDIRVKLHYLAEGVDVIQEYAKFRPADLHAVEARLTEALGSLQKTLKDGDTKRNVPLGEEAFPMTLNTSDCRFCNFRAMCKIEEGNVVLV